jgi:hypothetical protein
MAWEWMRIPKNPHFFVRTYTIGKSIKRYSSTCEIWSINEFFESNYYYYYYFLPQSKIASYYSYIFAKNIWVYETILGGKKKSKIIIRLRELTELQISHGGLFFVLFPMVSHKRMVNLLVHCYSAIFWVMMLFCHQILLMGVFHVYFYLRKY